MLTTISGGEIISPLCEDPRYTTILYYPSENDAKALKTGWGNDKENTESSLSKSIIPYLVDMRLSSPRVIYAPPTSSRLITYGTKSHCSKSSCPFPKILVETEIGPLASHYYENLKADESTISELSNFLYPPEWHEHENTPDEIALEERFLAEESAWERRYWKAIAQERMEERKLRDERHRRRRLPMGVTEEKSGKEISTVNSRFMSHNRTPSFPLVPESSASDTKDIKKKKDLQSSTAIITSSSQPSLSESTHSKPTVSQIPSNPYSPPPFINEEVGRRGSEMLRERAGSEAAHFKALRAHFRSQQQQVSPSELCLTDDRISRKSRVAENTYKSSHLFPKYRENSEVIVGVCKNPKEDMQNSYEDTFQSPTVSDLSHWQRRSSFPLDSLDALIHEEDESTPRPTAFTMRASLSSTESMCLLENDLMLPTQNNSSTSTLARTNIFDSLKKNSALLKEYTSRQTSQRKLTNQVMSNTTNSDSQSIETPTNIPSTTKSMKSLNANTSSIASNSLDMPDDRNLTNEAFILKSDSVASFSKSPVPTRCSPTIKKANSVHAEKVTSSSVMSSQVTLTSPRISTITSIEIDSELKEVSIPEVSSKSPDKVSSLFKKNSKVTSLKSNQSDSSAFDTKERVSSLSTPLESKREVTKSNDNAGKIITLSNSDENISHEPFLETEEKNKTKSVAPQEPLPNKSCNCCTIM